MSRYAIRLPPRAVWQGTWGIAMRSVPSPIRGGDRFSARDFSAHRPRPGRVCAAHAFRPYAGLAITMCARLLLRSPTGFAIAYTPPLSGAIGSP